LKNKFSSSEIIEILLDLKLRGSKNPNLNITFTEDFEEIIIVKEYENTLIR